MRCLDPKRSRIAVKTRNHYDQRFHRCICKRLSIVCSYANRSRLSLLHEESKKWFLSAWFLSWINTEYIKAYVFSPFPTSHWIACPMFGEFGMWVARMNKPFLFQLVLFWLWRACRTNVKANVQVTWSRMCQTGELRECVWRTTFFHEGDPPPTRAFRARFQITPLR